MHRAGSFLPSSGFGADDAWLDSSEMAWRVRMFDWSTTPLGPLDAWPRCLSAAVQLCLCSPSPMAIYWGSELTCIYNDAVREILGELHPRALGRPAPELLPATWDVVGAQLAAVIERGETTQADDQPRMLDRGGKLGLAYFTYSCSPIPDDRGGVGGALLVTHETTARVLAERRLQALHELVAQSREATTVGDACTQCARALARSDQAGPVLIYTLDERRRRATCVAAEAGPQALRGSPPSVELTGAADERAALFAELSGAGASGRLVPLALFVPARAGQTAFVAPVASGSWDRVDAVLVAGVRTDLGFDRAYAEFLELAAIGIARAIAAVRTREAVHRAPAGPDAGPGAAVSAGPAGPGPHEPDLRALLADLRAAQRRVVDAGDAERRRIERDLHDGAQQRLMALRLELGLLEEQLQHEPHAAVRQLPPLRRELDEALEELRELAHGLYPPLLASDGLETALAAMGRRSPIPVRVDAHGVARAPRAVESTAYFCCIEALQNAVKHAGPGARVTITLAMEDHALLFSVQDDGVGFDPGVVHPGHGLLNLRDRLSGLGGSVEIRSAPGAGTSLTGELPLA